MASQAVGTLDVKGVGARTVLVAKISENKKGQLFRESAIIFNNFGRRTKMTTRGYANP
jgi:hypothetical protein